MTAPVVSVALVTRNGAGTLPAVLDALSRQRVPFSFEVLAVDSGSVDGTVQMLEERADRVLTIPPEDFNHGLTRNFAVESSRGSLVVLLVQDAVPASDTWLAELTAPFADVRVAGTFARQVPQPGATPIVRHYHSQWVAAGDAPLLTALGPGEFETLEPMQRYLRCVFDNVCSCVRRDVWQRHPFKATAIAEDVEWARDVLLAGYRLAYAPGAVVIHSHNRPARYEFERTYVLHRRLYELFGLRTIPSLRLLARAIAASSLKHVRLRESVGRALALAVAWPAGQYLGALSAVRQWAPRRSRNV